MVRLFVFSVMVLFLLTACQSCEEELTGQACQADEDCGDDGQCVDERCVWADDADAGVDAEGDDVGELSCDYNRVACGQICCPEGMICDGGLCEPVCSGTVCGSDDQLCCTGADICFGDGCVTPGEECERTEDCAIGELCEPTLGQCLPRDQIAVCEFIPPGGEFSPDVGCTWVSDGLPERAGRGDIVATPVVANLTDDNGDGLTNTDDIPNIVFPSFNRNNQGCCNVPATLRILHGECNADGTMETIASISEPAINNDSGVALADLDGSGVPEIIGVTNIGGQPRGTVAFKRVADDGTEWEVMWHNQDYPIWDVHTRGGANVSVADLDGDGVPEIIIGNVVLDGLTGELKWDGNVTSGGEGGIGNNAFLGPAGTVADITGDGYLEVVTGNTVYDHQGNVVWSYEYTGASSTCQGQLACDGYTAVADITNDGLPNVIIVRQGDVYILDPDGELVAQVELPLIDCDRGNESGPPTVADFNGDGYREIGTAGADYYMIIKLQCDVDDWEAQGCADRGILWKTPTQDCSSRATASSVFDFHGDGRAEVVYADEVAFRIYDGSTGEVLFEDTRHESNTRIEMPIIADVSNNGRAEVLVPSAYVNRGDRPGLWVWADADGHWVRTRRIWNQHAYHVTNINEDGSVPVAAERNWENDRLNNFRQNVQPDGLFDAPDLLVHEIVATNTPFVCSSEGVIRTEVTVGNDGALGVSEGVAVDLELRDEEGDLIEHQRVHTTERLLPGQTETLVVEWEMSAGLLNSSLQVWAMIDPDGEHNECDDDNNVLLLQEVECQLQG